ncbi:MAG: hypothetical protein RML45_01350 [Acetobacteraceae bacterium]|nr:hypothetical protein [Acetobacteraceae bacterium]
MPGSLAVVLAALLPVVLIIALGWALRRGGALAEPFWSGAERLCYVVLLPAFLAHGLGTADLGAVPLGRLAVSIIGPILAVSALLVAIRPAPRPGRGSVHLRLPGIDPVQQLPRPRLRHRAPRRTGRWARRGGERADRADGERALGARLRRLRHGAPDGLWHAEGARDQPAHPRHGRRSLVASDGGTGAGRDRGGLAHRGAGRAPLGPPLRRALASARAFSAPSRAPSWSLA